MSAYGILSVNQSTLNQGVEGSSETVRESTRNGMITLLAVTQLALRGARLFPATSRYIPYAQLSLGFSMAIFTSRPLGATHIARGLIERFVPMGEEINSWLDIPASLYNMQQEKSTWTGEGDDMVRCSLPRSRRKPRGTLPHPQPNHIYWMMVAEALLIVYPPILKPLGSNLTSIFYRSS